jgi:hypothetical protein
VIRKVSSEGAILFWKATAMQRRFLQAAFDSIGQGHMVPKVDQMHCIREAARTVAQALGLTDDCKVDIRPLQSDRDAIGVEVRQFKKGLKKNLHPFLFSLGVTKAGGVKVLEVDPDVDALLCGDQDALRDAAQAEFTGALSMVDANKVTMAVVQLIKKMKGVLLRDGGGVYFVTRDNLDPYVQVGGMLSKYGPKLSRVVFSPEMNLDLVKEVCEFFEERLTGHCEEMQAEVKSLYAAGAAPRKNGQSRRVKELMESEQQLKTMAAFFGRPFSKCKSAIASTRAAIGAEGIKMAK